MGAERSAEAAIRVGLAETTATLAKGAGAAIRLNRAIGQTDHLIVS
jgi:hypothetical protein